MKQVQANNVRRRLQSFRFAINGILKFFRRETNARIHLAATILLGVTVFCFPVSRSEVITLLIVTGGVWTAELFNTVVERMMDLVSPDYHPDVEFIKDLSAGAVLVMAVTAVLAGMIIFIPKIL